MRRLRSGRTTAKPPFQVQCEKTARKSLGRVAVGTVRGHSWQRGVKHSFSSRCQSCWSIIVFLFLRGGVRQRLFCAFGFERRHGYHSSGNLITFPPTGNGRRSLFLLLLPPKNRGRKQGGSLAGKGKRQCQEYLCTSALQRGRKMHHCHIEAWGLLFWEEAEARILFLQLMGLTLELLSRICHARSDLLSDSSRIFFWQQFFKLDSQCLLGVFSESFIMKAQLLRLKKKHMLSSEVLFAYTDSFSGATPIPFYWESVGTGKCNPTTYFAHGYRTGSVPAEFGKEVLRGSL